MRFGKVLSVLILALLSPLSFAMSGSQMAKYITDHPGLTLLIKTQPCTCSALSYEEDNVSRAEYVNTVEHHWYGDVEKRYFKFYPSENTYSHVLSISYYDSDGRLVTLDPRSSIPVDKPKKDTIPWLTPTNPTNPTTGGYW